MFGITDLFGNSNSNLMFLWVSNAAELNICYHFTNFTIGILKSNYKGKTSTLNWFYFKLYFLCCFFAKVSNGCLTVLVAIKSYALPQSRALYPMALIYSGSYEFIFLELYELNEKSNQLTNKRSNEAF